MIFTPENKFYYSNSEYLNYRIVGEGNHKIIFLHGFGASSRTWDDVIQYLDLKDYQLILIDMIGSGFSSKPKKGTYSMHANAEVVARFIEEKGYHDYILAGHSFGGGVALLSTIRLKDEYENQPRALILIDAAAYKTNLPFFVKYLRIPIIGNILLSLISPEFQVRYTLKKIFYDKNKVTDDMVHKYAFFMSLQGHNNALIQTAKQIIPKDFQKYEKRYKTLDMPVLILWGRHDPAIPLECGKKLENVIPQSSLSIIEECGHSPLDEQPRETADQISVFIHRLGEK